MSRQPFGVGFVCAIALAVASVRPASAQPPSASPYAGLFGGTSKDQPQSLDLRGSLFGAYDDNLVAAATGQTIGDLLNPAQQMRPGFGSGLDGSLAYAFRAGQQSTHFRVNANAGIRGFSSSLTSDPLWFRNFDVGSNLSTKISPKTTVSFGGGVVYAPYYQYVPFLKDVAAESSPVGMDYGYALGSDWVLSGTANASLAYAFARRSRISVDGSWTTSHVTGTTYTGASGSGNAPTLLPGIDSETRAVQATFAHNLTRKLSFHAGYGVQESRWGTGHPPFTTQLIDIGVGYGDGITIQFARHYTLSMNIGASIAKNGDPALVLRTGKQTAFLVTGGATLSRSIGRAWSTSIGYNRGTSYIVGYQEPLMSDTASAGIGGPVTQRMFFSAGAGASRGQFAFSGGTITSYTASSRLSYAVFTHLSAFVQGSYYKYEVPPAYAVYGLAPQLTRNSVTAGLSTWVPLIKTKRSHRDTR